MSNKPVASSIVIPSSGVIAGETIAQWTQDWWTWQLQAPLNANPLLDTTGAYADYNNNGSMFFLGGSLDQKEVVIRGDVAQGEPMALRYPTS